jgi:hypothetical protein
MTREYLNPTSKKAFLVKCSQCSQIKEKSQFYTSKGKLSSRCKACAYATYRATYIPKHGATDDDRPCLHCGRIYQPKQRRKSSYCSRDCKFAARNLKSRQHRTKMKAAVTRLCVICNEPILSTNRSDKKYCSMKCAEDVRGKINNSSRRLRTDSPFERISRFEIYSRDKWECQLCHKPVKRELTWPHKQCASLDHILPLSRGGTNTVANLQLAHYSCNSRRGDKLLIGAPRTGLLIKGKQYYRVGEAANYLGCHYSVLSNAIKSGRVPSSQLGVKKGSWSYIESLVVEQLALTGIPGSKIWKSAQPRRPRKVSRLLLCLFCQKEIEVSIDLKSPRKYCSTNCIKSARKTRNVKAKRIVCCHVCNSEMPLPDGKPTYLCSDKCRKINRQKRLAAQTIKEEKDCAVCGRRFQLPRKPGHPPKTCSQSCAKKWPAIKSRNYWLTKKSLNAKRI